MIIEDCWNEFAAQCGKDWDAEDCQHARRIFFAGGIALFDALFVKPKSKAEAAQRYDAVLEELENFAVEQVELVTAGRGGRA